MAMSMGRIVGIVGGVLLILGVFFPWASVSNTLTSVDVSGMNILGIPVLILGLIGLLFVATGRRGLCLGAGILGIISLIWLMLMMGALSWIASAAAIAGTTTVSMSYGLYLCVIGTIALVVGGFWAWMDAKKAAKAPAPVTQPPAPPAP